MRHCVCHLQNHLAIPVLYASSWLLTAFASDFPIFFSSRVMDIILTDRYVVAIMKVCSVLTGSLPCLLLVQPAFSVPAGPPVTDKLAQAIPAQDCNAPLCHPLSPVKAR